MCVVTFNAISSLVVRKYIVRNIEKKVNIFTGIFIWQNTFTHSNINISGFGPLCYTTRIKGSHK